MFVNTTNGNTTEETQANTTTTTNVQSTKKKIITTESYSSKTFVNKFTTDSNVDGLSTKQTRGSKNSTSAITKNSLKKEGKSYSLLHTKLNNISISTTTIFIIV